MSSGTDSSATQRYEHMQYRRCGASGLTLPAVSLGAWETYGGSHGRRRRRGLHHGGVRPRGHPLRLRQQLRPSARQRRSGLRRDRAPAPPRRDRRLHQGRVPHVGRAATAGRVAQAPDRQLRPVAAPARPRLRRHLLPPLPRPGDADRRDARRAEDARRPRQGAVRRACRATPASSSTRRSPSPRASACRSPSTSRTTTSSVARSRRTCCPGSSRPAPGSSRSVPWRRGCSPTSTSTAR